MTVTKDSIIGEVLDADIETAQYFFEIGMHCLGCPASRSDSLQDADAVHGIPAEQVIEAINAKIAENK